MIYQYGKDEANNNNWNRLLSSETMLTVPVDMGGGIFDFVTPRDSIVLIESALIDVNVGALPGNRQAIALCVDPFGVFIWGSSSLIYQTAASGVIYTWARGLSPGLALLNFMTMPLPNIILHDGQTFRVWITGLQGIDTALNAIVQYKILQLNRP